ncbi:MAG TPA: hypothetical protein PLC40_09810, partial [Candidatus Hydrogenedentes bacterium]|nr:hypothetical protein [Candidatus Hydrogenedentota bacterium]
IAALYEGNPQRLEELLNNIPALEKFLNDLCEQAQSLWEKLEQKGLPKDSIMEIVQAEVFAPINARYNPETFKRVVNNRFEAKLKKFHRLAAEW